MILTGIINLFISLLGILFFWLPNHTSILPEMFEEVWDWLSDWIAQILWVMPEGEVFFKVISLVLMIESIIFLFQQGNYIYNKLRGSGN